MLYVIGPGYKVSDDATVVNTTSRSSNWSRGLSPFFAGPCDLYNGFKSYNVENAWQYSKVYEYYLEDDGTIGPRYFKWAEEGWNTLRAHRYPMGKEARPLYSYWDGQTYSYTEARSKIYIPVYVEAVQKTSAFKQLKKLYEAGGDLYMWDFDAHSLQPGTFDYWDLWNNPNIKVGHAYVLAMLLENKLP